jgi:hypothetical protein
MKQAFAVAALSFVIAGPSLGQAPPPPPPQPTTTISCTSRVQGLQYDSTATPNCQAVPFTFTAAVPQGRTVVSIKWYVDGTLLSYGSSSTSFTYKAIGVGKHTLNIQMFTDYSTYNGSLTFAAIGGPLTYFVLGGENSGVERPEHDDNNINKPWYLEYFGYIASGSKPSGAQASQYGGTLIRLGQLDGTTYEWHVDGPALGSGGSTDTGCSVFPCSGSDRGEIRVRVTYTFEDPEDTTLAGTAEDDSLQTPPPNETAPRTAYYSFTSHQPDYVVALGPATYKHDPGGIYPNLDLWTWQDVYFHQLLDQNGDGQPGVWIAERFPGSSAAIQAWNAAWGQNLTFENMGNTGVTWTSRLGGIGIEQGEIDNGDLIGLADICGNAAHPDPMAYQALVLTQNLYAATRSTTLGDWGLLTRAFTNTMTLTSVSHD